MLVLALLLNKFKPAVWFGMCARVPCGAVLGMYMCLYTVDEKAGNTGQLVCAQKQLPLFGKEGRA